VYCKRWLACLSFLFVYTTALFCLRLRLRCDTAFVPALCSMFSSVPADTTLPFFLFLYFTIMTVGHGVSKRTRALQVHWPLHLALLEIVYTQFVIEGRGQWSSCNYEGCNGEIKQLRLASLIPTNLLRSYVNAQVTSHVFTGWLTEDWF
jgi:hypothetical protein